MTESHILVKPLTEMASEDIKGRGANAGTFSPFSPTMFSYLAETNNPNLTIHVSDMSSACAFNFEQSIILLFGKDSTILFVQTDVIQVEGNDCKYQLQVSYLYTL